MTSFRVLVLEIREFGVNSNFEDIIGENQLSGLEHTLKTRRKPFLITPPRGFTRPPRRAERRNTSWGTLLSTTTHITLVAPR